MTLHRSLALFFALAFAAPVPARAQTVLNWRLPREGLRALHIANDGAVAVGSRYAARGLALYEVPPADGAFGESVYQVIDLASGGAAILEQDSGWSRLGVLFRDVELHAINDRFWTVGAAHPARATTGPMVVSPWGERLGVVTPAGVGFGALSTVGDGGVAAGHYFPVVPAPTYRFRPFFTPDVATASGRVAVPLPGYSVYDFFSGTTLVWNMVPRAVSDGPRASAAIAGIAWYSASTEWRVPDVLPPEPYGLASGGSGGVTPVPPAPAPATSTPRVPVLWDRLATSPRLRFLPLPAGYVTGYPYAVVERGTGLVVVGTAATSEAALWDPAAAAERTAFVVDVLPTSMLVRSLDEVARASSSFCPRAPGDCYGVHFTEARDINARGQIVAYGHFPGWSQEFSFLLGEPGAL